LSIGGSPFSVLKKARTSANERPSLILTAAMKCGSCPTFSNSTSFFPAFSPSELNAYSFALTLASAAGTSPSVPPETVNVALASDSMSTAT